MTFVLHAEAGGWKYELDMVRREATPGEVTPFAARPRKRVPHEFVLATARGAVAKNAAYVRFV